MNQELSGKLAVITGAGTGIGRKTAELFAASGCYVFVTGLDIDKCRETLAIIGDENGEAHKLDVALADDWEKLTAALNEAGKGIDLLVNNAGYFLEGDLNNTDLDAWNKVMDTNLTGVFLGCKFAEQHMNDGGSIINVSSVAALVGTCEALAYGAAKAGVTHLTKSAALYFASTGRNIRCNNVHPTTTRTEILDKLAENLDCSRDELFARVAQRIPLRKVCEPEDIANAIVYLASDKAKMVTGTSLVVDGGVTAGPEKRFSD